DPSRLIGLHFFAPAHIMKLLEIVKGEKVSPKALAMGYAVAKRLGKIPVVAGVCDGFIGNRILARYREAADTLLMDGCTPWDIDAAMVDFGYAMGPYEAQDLSGLDIAHANRRRQDDMRDPARRYIPIADHVVAAGRLGRKTGAGWYQYPANGGKDIDPVIETMILQTAASAGINRRAFTHSDIQNRLVLAMINEAANILFDGIAARAADIDLVLVHGYGFPRWRGGLLHYADQIGVDRLLAMLRMCAAEDPLVWRPSPVIIDCAEAKISLANWQAENH
ncbi:MAG: 3-hydroxyacyl-CoA dehydrogenase family protein, partial [Alphaproteobacteria bacterium]